MTAVPPLEPHRAARWEQDDAPEALRARLVEELARHGDSMSRRWSDNDAEPVTVELGCRCGFVRGTVTAAELAGNLDGWLRKHREHVADAALAVVTTPVPGAPEVRVTFDEAEAAHPCPTCVREGAPYPCCPHCADDPIHDVPVNGHDLPCSTCIRAAISGGQS